MTDLDDLLAVLGDADVSAPTAGDAGDRRLRSALQQQIMRRRRIVWRTRALVSCTGVGAAVAVGVVIAGGGSGLSRSSSPQTSASLLNRSRETAFIIQRVRVRLAHLAAGGEGQVLERTETIGNGTQASPIVQNSDWCYVDPRSKVAYQRSIDRSSDGVVLSIDRLISTPISGVVHTQATFLNPSQDAYFIQRDAPPGGTVRATRSSTQLGITSTARQIDQALKNGTATMRGTATIRGVATIKLSFPPPPVEIKLGLPRQTTFTLYVNAHTYQPIQEVRVAPRGKNPADGDHVSTTRWLPATPSNVALAKVRIPASYRHATGPISDFWTLKKPLFFLGY